MKKMSRLTQIILTIVCIALGLLLASQYRAQVQSRTPTGIVAASSAEQVAVISDLVEGNASLRKEVEGLRQELASYQGVGEKSSLEAMVEELNRMRIVNGLLEVAGPGVEVQISGGMNALDLQDLINELRNAGAEAVALNNRRVVVRSVVGVSGKNLYLDGTLLASPYLLQAIGNPKDLVTALERKGGLVSGLRATYPQVKIEVTQRENLVLPIYQGQYEFKYARPMK
jgi:uncharacterized protein YlxW (UPF0749 family)